MTTDSEEPDFAALRAQRNARVRASIQALANEWGVDVESLKTTYRPTASQLAAAVAAERERAARVCERIADDYNQRESLKYAELKTDAETGANECGDAIRAGAKSDG